MITFTVPPNTNNCTSIWSSSSSCNVPDAFLASINLTRSAILSKATRLGLQLLILSNATTTFVECSGHIFSPGHEISGLSKSGYKIPTLQLNVACLSYDWLPLKLKYKLGYLWRWCLSMSGSKSDTGHRLWAAEMMEMCSTIHDIVMKNRGRSSMWIFILRR